MFKLCLIDELCEVAATLDLNTTQQVSTQPGRPRTSNPVERLEGCKHMIVYSPDDRRCKVCVNKPTLHLKHCFKVWHTQLHFLS